MRMQSRQEKIRAARLHQPEEELLRKRQKAARKDIWTQEDIDHADVAGRILFEKLNAKWGEVVEDTNPPQGDHE